MYLDIENRGTDVSQWKKVLTNDMINQYLSSVNGTRIADQRLDPVTTSNGITFVSQNGSSRNANETSSYLEFKVWFIATTDMYVHLSGQTVQVEGSNATTACTTTETGSKADIIRAVRTSFEDSGSAAIWELNRGTPVNGQSTFDVGQSFGADSRLFHLNKLEPKQITVRIWAEGNDPECDNDVQDSNLTIQMLFGGADENGNSFE
ncbi:hypothetical protein [uncultured Ruminococcus sp.]|uniref:hypothetical protein n=1 Tax=uncultured Ruminococcus sp. TaxID=165186 RepID=UPI00292F2F31|nr:hypothetical protein [uncultured Ruminococcus sp.]